MNNEEEVVLTQPREEVATWVVVGFLFVVAGVAGILWGEGLQRIAGILAILIFGFVLVIGITQMFKPDQLIVRDDGFTRISHPFNASGEFLRWDQVSHFEVGVGGRGGPGISFMKTLDNNQSSQPLFSSLKSMGGDAFELAEMMNERRSQALGESREPPKIPKRKKTSGSPKTASSRQAADAQSIDFPASPTGRAPAVSGSYAYIARSLLSASRIAERFGEKLVKGTVDGKAAQAVVAPVVELGELVFVKDRLGSRVLMPEGGNYNEGFKIAKTISQGRIRKASRR